MVISQSHLDKYSVAKRTSDGKVRCNPCELAFEFL